MKSYKRLEGEDIRTLWTTRYSGLILNNKLPGVLVIVQDFLENDKEKCIYSKPRIVELVRETKDPYFEEKGTTYYIKDFTKDVLPEILMVGNKRGE